MVYREQQAPLRFDVETINKATFLPFLLRFFGLRFDVETINKATFLPFLLRFFGLRFDVETINKATVDYVDLNVLRCGLM